MPKESNVGSRVLTIEEHTRLFRLLGEHCVTLATGVVQLYLASSERSPWHKKYTGVVGFIKDYGKHSFYIRLYDIMRNMLVWQQEIYNELETFTLHGSFIYFEAHDCIAGLLFANDEDAFAFKSAVQAKLDKRNNQASRNNNSQNNSRPMPTLQAKKSMNISGDLHLQTTEVRGGGAPELNNRLTVDDMRSPQIIELANKKGKKGKKDKKKKSRPEISAPIAGSFKVEAHVGAENGIDFNDPAMLELLRRAGLADGRLGATEKNLVVDIIKANGGMTAVQKRYGPLAANNFQQPNVIQQQQQQPVRRASQPQTTSVFHNGHPIPAPPPLSQPELPPLHSMKSASQVQSSRQQLQQMQTNFGGMMGTMGTIRASDGAVLSARQVQQWNGNGTVHMKTAPPPSAPELPPRDAAAPGKPQLPPRPSTGPPQQRPMNGAPPGPPPPPPPPPSFGPPQVTAAPSSKAVTPSAPPAPPPLPPTNGGPPPPPPMPTQVAKAPSLPVADIGRNQLMDAIRKHGGSATLKHIRSSQDENNSNSIASPRRESTGSSPCDPRDSMLAQIKDGSATMRLKKVGPPESHRHSEIREDGNDLAAQLRRALQSRQGVLQPSSDEDDSDDDEEEWAS